MAQYHYFRDHLHQRRHRFVRRSKRLFVVLTTTILIIGVIIGVDVFLQTRSKPTVTSDKGAAVVESPFLTIRSGYFQFQAPKTWVEIANETTNATYVYRSLQNELLEQELDIYINRQPPDLAATRVLPVMINNDSLVGMTVSDQCRNALPPSDKSTLPQIVTWQTVQFSCIVNSNEYTVVVGQKNGGTSLPMTRPDGTAAGYTILYKNLKSTPDSKDLDEIIQTFHTR